MVGGRHEKIFNIIFLNGLHTFDSLTTTILGFKIINSHTFDITQTGHGDNGIFVGNQILHIDIIDIITDLTATIITVFICNFRNFFLNNA